MSALRKVLVVDDDPVVGRSFDRVLSGKGYAVITASSGQEALTKLETEEYDVVFTDIKMPGMSGLEVVERVKERRPWLPVVIVTGYGSPANEARAEGAGVSGFLRKPLSPEMIEESAIKALLERDAAPAAPAQAEAVPAPQPAAAEAAPRSVGGALKIALFFAAPFAFAALAYIIVSPFVGPTKHTLFDFVTHVKGIEYLLSLFFIGGYLILWEALKPKPFGTLVQAGKEDMDHLKTSGSAWKIVGSIAAAPFIGLAYILAIPLVGLGMLAWISGKALMKYGAVRKTAIVMKNVGMLIVGPLVGLAFILFMPLVGAAMLAWIGGRALLNHYEAK